MVYCGKPSKGCSSCRERKIRCDQREPGCGQCEKRQQQCPGYRNLVDLMFRDESSHVIKKATKSRVRRQAASAAAAATTGSPAASPSPSSEDTSLPAGPLPRSPRPSPQPSGSRPRMHLALLTPSSRVSRGIQWNPRPETDGDLLPSPDEGTWPKTPMADLAYSISPSFQERGTAYFFSRYVTGHENACHQNYDFVYDIWKPASLLPERQVDCVMASMTAVGLAGLSSLTRCDNMMDWARRSYGIALRLTNEALRNAKEAVKDSTVLSVLILGTYEMLTGRTPQTVKAWQEHVHGAAALVNMRGTAQFHTKAGIRMFMMSHQTVMIACMQQDIPMPKALIDLRNELGRLIGTAEPGWRIPEPIYKALQVRYDIQQGLLTDTDVIIEKLTSIDEECLRICEEFPKSWAYRVVRFSRPNPMVLSDSCHVYPSLLIGNAWNGMRTIRLLAHETIVGEIMKKIQGRDVKSMQTRHMRQLARSVAILKAIRDAIIASVPQYFGAVSSRNYSAVDDLDGSSSPPIIDAKNPVYHVVPSPLTNLSPIFPPSLLSPTDFSCPTILDPMQSKGAEEEKRLDRFMTVASASHTIVWPLYLVGMASCCTEEIKEYVIERLMQVHKEGVLLQARPVAAMVQERDLSCPWAGITLDDLSPEELPSSPI